MKKTKILIFCLLALLVHVPVIHADPIQLKELKSDAAPVKFKPLYAKVPESWEVITKSFKTAHMVIYLSNNDSVLSIMESNINGRDINIVENTEQFVKGGVIYYYTAYKNRAEGGKLCWVNNHIYFEMDSVYLDKDTMLTYAMTVN